LPLGPSEKKAKAAIRAALQSTGIQVQFSHHNPAFRIDKPVFWVTVVF
jgi:hypothetical protein